MARPLRIPPPSIVAGPLKKEHVFADSLTLSKTNMQTVMVEFRAETYVTFSLFLLPATDIYVHIFGGFSVDFWLICTDIQGLFI